MKFWIECESHYSHWKRGNFFQMMIFEIDGNTTVSTLTERRMIFEFSNCLIICFSHFSSKLNIHSIRYFKSWLFHDIFQDLHYKFLAKFRNDCFEKTGIIKISFFSITPEEIHFEMNPSKYEFCYELQNGERSGFKEFTHFSSKSFSNLTTFLQVQII